MKNRKLNLESLQVKSFSTTAQHIIKAGVYQADVKNSMWFDCPTEEWAGCPTTVSGTVN